ncbi:MAG: DUF4476 domain-containing protein [Bacteroidia bacterium]|jgi:Domain of unknown function (DUF4476)|nr:DUF4476 domain-containing protein [Sphingobacteriaceae bacterium]MBK7817450.1 DUF4476 domain-containing protein [Sphingobacteriaceae bacterium]MBP9069435.1 DUF4476 domain-containing protein [Bacteroidia bacterium]
MKKTITYLALFILVVSTTVKAQDLGKLMIRNSNKAFPNFIASLNGIRLSNDYAPAVAFNMLDEYQYRIKILQAGSTTMISYTLASEPKYLSKYVIVKDNYGNYSIMLESKSLIMDEPEVPTQTLTPVVTTSLVQTKTQINPATQTVAATPTTAASTSVVITAISSADFNDRLDAVKKASFDRDKIAKIKQVFADEYLTTNQVGELVKIFPFDDDKLSVAQWCYKGTIDKKNYFKVENHFTFDRYKKQLGDWVSKQPK